MVGTIELDPDGKTLQIRFPYRPDLVDEVKLIPGRRWDRGGKLWRVPSDQVENVVALFMRHGFTMTSDVSSLLAGTSGTPAIATAADASDDGEESTGPDALSISKLNEQAKSAIKVGFPEPVWVIGELTDYEKNKDRKHVFFTMSEKRGESVVAEVSVAMFERTAKMLRTKLDNLKEPMTLADGIEIRALVRVDLYPKNGRYQCIVEDIDASFTLGKLALGREEILKELREKGLDRINRELPLPIPPLRVGVLTSHSADGFHDFLAEMKSAEMGFEITAYDVRVQGEMLRPTMLQGLRYFADRAADFDVLCIIRGGGSRTDLAWFDEREVAIAVANHPLKILCGIGHQRDQSVLDLICHSEKTPTAVADFLIEQVQQARGVLADLARCLVDSTRRMLSVEGRRLGELAHSLRHRVSGALAFERERLGNCAHRVTQGTRHRLRSERDSLLRRVEQVQGAARRRLDHAKAFLTTQEARQRLLDPKRVLNRGYTLARLRDGGILTSAQDLSPGMELHILFRDGGARTRVEELFEADHGSQEEAD